MNTRYCQWAARLSVLAAVSVTACSGEPEGATTSGSTLALIGSDDVVGAIGSGDVIGSGGSGGTDSGGAVWVDDLNCRVTGGLGTEYCTLVRDANGNSCGTAYEVAMTVASVLAIHSSAPGNPYTLPPALSVDEARALDPECSVALGNYTTSRAGAEFAISDARDYSQSAVHKFLQKQAISTIEDLFLFVFNSHAGLPLGVLSAVANAPELCEDIAFNLGPNAHFNQGHRAYLARNAVDAARHAYDLARSECCGLRYDALDCGYITDGCGSGVQRACPRSDMICVPLDERVAPHRRRGTCQLASGGGSGGPVDTGGGGGWSNGNGFGWGDPNGFAQSACYGSCSCPGDGVGGRTGQLTWDPNPGVCRCACTDVVVKEEPGE